MKNSNLEHLRILEWDIEYWQSYIRQYENDEIKCDEEAKVTDLKECRKELNKSLNRYYHFKKKTL